MESDFDPADPPDGAEGLPLAEYVRPPVGLSVVANIQFLLAGLTAALGFAAYRQGQAATGPFVASIAIPCALLLLAGVGLWQRVMWGWWLAATLYYCLFFNIPVNIASWTVKADRFAVGANLLVFALAVSTLAYLMRAESLRFIRFRTPDGRPTRWILISPAVTGLGWAVVRLVRLMTA